MNQVLDAWNKAGKSAALEPMLACCAALRWAEAVVALRPYASVESMSLTADEVWSTMEEPDWLEAFGAHPRIGERKTTAAWSVADAWSQEEQSSTVGAANEMLSELTKLNDLYEDRFGFTYIVCASGKSAEEMLSILQRRLESDRETELREAAEQQRQIMQVRLGKWLAE